MVLRKADDIQWQNFEKCHNGAGTLFCKSLLVGFEPSKFAFMHHDRINAGISIGEHPHTNHEEIYYLMSGTGTLIFDGKEYEMNPGDISLCNLGHSHGFIAKTDCVMIVVG